MKCLTKIFCLCSILLFLLVCCSKKKIPVIIPEPDIKNTVVLLPDPDGKVGVLEVNTQKGTQVIDKANFATHVVDSNEVPSNPAKMDEKEIVETFSEALAAHPEPPVKFILYFKTGTTKLTTDSHKLIPKTLVTIEQRKSNYISVIGHTDRVGSDKYNKKLSLRRASSIRNLLISQNVLLMAVEISYYGESNPIIETEDEVSEPLNRRVEVIVR